ncbi:MAG: substrate-binding domain-containing protein [Flavobacteriaceae bacterium]|nr:substrate-binding domain-containing protein [Flavobacteriaceae bacterium]
MHPKTVRICGVPEHFNLPWHNALENKLFEQQNIRLIWTDVPEGTGKMSQMLRENQTDLAVILTEGITKEIANGNPAKIVQTYVESPLLWGVHVGTQSLLSSLKDLENARVAVSRMGSGSHLMAMVLAKKLGLKAENLSFEVVQNLEGAIRMLSENDDIYFMWEHFTTKPLVDKNLFKRIGDCPTPWPCFVIAATDVFIDESVEVLHTILKIINTVTLDFKKTPDLVNLISEKYQQKREDVASWLAMTNWSQKQISSTEIEVVQQELFDLGLISKRLKIEFILWD